MEAASDEESNKFNSSSPSDAPKKPKRQMKTPFQLETLEKTYASEAYPTEATRAELSDKLGLSDRQLQMWFCHRRLKDKREAAGGKVSKGGGQVGRKGHLDSPREEFKVLEPGSGHGSRSGSGSGSGSDSGSGSSQYEYVDDVPTVPRYYESPRSVMERRAIACVEAQLGEPLREDGPILGMEFDELPPGAFGAAMALAEHGDRMGHSYGGNVYEHSDAKLTKAAMRGLHDRAEPGIRYDAYGHDIPSHIYDTPVDGPSTISSSFMHEKGQLSRGYGLQSHALSVTEFSEQGKRGRFLSPLRDAENSRDDIVFQMERKRKSDEARIEMDVQAHEKKIKKELEKQDVLRRKREEQMRKEMEKQDRERRKEEERMMREKQRQEERVQREEKREMERREKFMQKELLRAERRRQKEELRREKEATRIKAATERAAARRIAKESMELIEDERLELMELAVLSKGLSSFVSLDYDTLQNLEPFRDSLRAFPPKSVQLKRPFTIQPWMDFEENIGNLLMVWRFCMTLGDVLGLWPFTLDEFVQAFHDCDSRLLGEIHIALLRLIIKDIEDGARTPSGGPGTNQYTSISAEGGHPQIVEGAYIWGFDIRIWQKHLNPLTWPEILRQFALSAGFGPQLEKKNIEQQSLQDNDEGKSSEDTVFSLRNGSAVENAVAMMQEKGFSLQRKSRHRVTPGTVKFAAYHVLALEGSKGLTVLELADKIQKSGLRDLTTSKTPEASISVALSRDPVLFERIAPSTYCVRPAFRKDPADAEALLSSAREKIQKYVNGFLSENANDMERDDFLGGNANDVERDDDSECDVAEGTELNNLVMQTKKDKNDGNYDAVSICLENGKDNVSDDIASSLQNVFNGTNTGAPTESPIRVADRGIGVIKVQGDTEIDESTSGEPWVQGLTEGEYSDLCVEERLHALVALIGIANEGNTVRAVLEGRLDAANALKKQLWAEAQLDKRRVKEESIIKFHDASSLAAAEGSQSPLAIADNKTHAMSLSTAVKEEPSSGAANVQDQFNSLPAEGCVGVNDISMDQVTPSIQKNGYSAERVRMQLKSFINHRAEEMYVYRSLPLGQDRRQNRYWQFVASASRHDPGSGRIFVESPGGKWRLIDSEEAFDSLVMSLDTRGTRESHLHIMLQKIEKSFKENVRRNMHYTGSVDENGDAVRNEATVMGLSPSGTAAVDSPCSTVCGSDSETLEPSSSFSIELGRNEVEKNNALKRYEDVQVWMWKECFNSSSLSAMRYGKTRCAPLLRICDFCLDSYVYEEDVCPSCHRSSARFDSKLGLSEFVSQCAEKMKANQKCLIILDSSHPMRIRLLKALFAFLEVSLSSEAIKSSWTENQRKAWGLKLQRSSCTEHLVQILTQFEGVIKRDCLSSDFETTEELLGLCAWSGSVSYDPLSVTQLPWMPQTTAAVALRFLELDACVSYGHRQKADLSNDKETEDIIKVPLRSACMKNIHCLERTKVDRKEHKKEKLVGLSSIRRVSGSKQMVHRRGNGRPKKKLQAKVIGSMSEARRQNSRVDETLTHVLLRQGHTAQGQRHGRGPRTVRKRRMEKRAVEETLLSQLGNSPDCIGKSPSCSSGEEWVSEDIQKMQIDNEDEDEDNDDDIVEANESNGDAHALVYERGQWVKGFSVTPDGSLRDLMVSSDEDVDGSEKEDCSEEEVDENLEGSVDVTDGSDGNGDQNEDDGSDSVNSGEYGG